jgi:hypothetical protein
MTAKNGSSEVVSTVAMWTIRCVSSSSTLVLIFGRSRGKEVFIYWGWVPSLTGSPMTLSLCISVQIFSRPSMETNRHTGQSKRHAGQTKRRTGQSKRHTGQPNIHAGQPNRHAGQSNTHTGQSKRHNGQSKIHAGQSNRHTAPPSVPKTSKIKNSSSS